MDSISQNRIFSDVFKMKSAFTRFAYFYVADKDVAEDLVMDAFVYCWERRNEININDNIRAYFLSVIKNKCLDYLRTAKRHEEIERELADDASWDLKMRISTLEALSPYKVFSEEFRDTVHKAIMHLPQKTRDIFLLSRRNGMRYSDIAAETGLSVKTVEYHISQALKLLKSDLRELYIFALIFNFFA